MERAELTEKEAKALEAIGRGENPCARVGDEHPDIVGLRRRAVGGLRKKGYVVGGEPVRRSTRHAVEATVPSLTAKGSNFIAGRSTPDRGADQPYGMEDGSWR